MESGIKHGNIGDIAKDLFGGLDTQDAGRVVQRGQGVSSRRVSITSGVIRQLAWNFSPPWTTRWPMALISLTSSMTLPSPVVIFFTTSANASV